MQVWIWLVFCRQNTERYGLHLMRLCPNVNRSVGMKFERTWINIRRRWNWQWRGQKSFRRGTKRVWREKTKRWCFKSMKISKLKMRSKIKRKSRKLVTISSLEEIELTSLISSTRNDLSEKIEAVNFYIIIKKYNWIDKINLAKCSSSPQNCI